jgi:hypothetical protein
MRSRSLYQTIPASLVHRLVNLKETTPPLPISILYNNLPPTGQMNTFGVMSQLTYEHTRVVE